MSVEDGIDTSTPAGELMAKMAILMAEWERKAIRARVRAGIDAARRSGHADGLERLPAPGGVHGAVKHRAQLVERHLAERVPGGRVGGAPQQPELPSGSDGQARRQLLGFRQALSRP